MSSNKTTLLDKTFISESLYGIRSIFYLLTPNETYYEKAEQVPDLTQNVILKFLYSR
jgi:hypothetical protein